MVLYRSGLNSSKDIKCSERFTFAQNTTYALGGGVLKAYFPSTVLQAKIAYDQCKREGKPFVVLGNGSNILASDKFFEGSVICTKKLRGIIKLKDGKLLCLAGTKISELLSYCKKRGMGGLEYLAGIPATVGGAASMNAGIGTNSISENINYVVIYGDKASKLSNRQCDFGYRHSTMRDINALILYVVLQTYASTCDKVEENIMFNTKKRARLPKGKSCGCVFKNPQGYSAGYLIEACGLKGQKLGAAQVSPYHANFIINYGNKADDVKRLIDFVKCRVFERFGILLSEEVVYIGDFNDINS